MSIPTEYTYWQYWTNIAMKIPGLFFYSWRVWGAFVALILFFVILYNKKIGDQLIEKWKGISPWWSIAIIVFMVIWGISLAIYERDKEVFRAYKAAEEKYKPEIRSSIDGVFVTTQTESPEILIIANITNTGEPTGIEGWKLDVTLPDGKQIPAKQFRIFLDNISMQLPSGAIKLDLKDALYNKALNPIAKGAIVRGFMVFIMPKDFKKESITLKDTQVKLSFMDIFHNLHSAAITIGPQFIEPVYFPGLSWPDDKH